MPMSIRCVLVNIGITRHILYNGGKASRLSITGEERGAKDDNISSEKRTLDPIPLRARYLEDKVIYRCRTLAHLSLFRDKCLTFLLGHCKGLYQCSPSGEMADSC